MMLKEFMTKGTYTQEDEEELLHECDPTLLKLATVCPPNLRKHGHGGRQCHWFSNRILFAGYATPKHFLHLHLHIFYTITMKHVVENTRIFYGATNVVKTPT